jgi:tRNA(Ile2) C34 agmatinyltransferase TiaS
MTPVACPRCNARQNIALGARGFECWQCKTRISEPG